MNKLILIGVLGATLLATCRGDDLKSLYPLYEDRDLVSEEGLVGEWYFDDGWRVIFSRAGEGYKVTIDAAKESERKEVLGFDCFLVRLEGSLFLDLSQDVSELFPGIRGHYFIIIRLDGDTLQATGFKEEWLRQKVVDEAALQYVDIHGGQRVITAPTRELQWFVRQYAHDPDAFEEWISFHRRAPDSGGGGR